jgi:hypothetical protein
MLIIIVIMIIIMIIIIIISIKHKINTIDYDIMNAIDYVNFLTLSAIDAKTLKRLLLKV